MEIDNTKRFKITNIAGEFIGNGKVEDVLTDENDMSIASDYIVRFDNGDIGCCNVNNYNFTPIDDLREYIRNVMNNCLEGVHEELIEGDLMYDKCDSLDYVDMVMTLEKSFNITLDENKDNMCFSDRNISVTEFIDWVIKKKNLES